ncbi:hypothetical protein JNUCC31_01915 [Paenibacillus sp. JNUCC31]|uniref:hypothetical protein n=1 Tax=unclassified Paenibacillus TaxID=185978 RepID=UPI00177B3583|nr:hypothetical protein [Paenibacillus sp. JNUCC-31]QOS79733.1 hypothetical protein JNUCC31_01915 [Paenibacillus sp. JNUCC-31]
MSEGIKVELEVSAFGQESVREYDDSFRKHEIVRTRILPKETTLEQLEVLVKEMMAEIKEDFQQPEQLIAKVTLRAKETDGVLKYLG